MQGYAEEKRIGINKDVAQIMCRAKRLIYVTTAGGIIYDDLDFAEDK